MDSFNITDVTAEPLNKQETIMAVHELVNPVSFPKVNRKFIDPMKPGDLRFALFSFIKAEGAEPNQDGLFGVAKIRGAFFTEKEASARAEEIIRDVDSTNSIFTCIIGAPFPVVVKGFSTELVQIDLQDKTEQTISDNVRAKRRAEQKEMEEIKARRDLLMQDEGKIEASELDKYIEQRVKLAHLRYAISEHSLKLEECKELEKKVRINLTERCIENPDFEKDYLARYKQSRRDAHIPEETDMCGFMRHMTEPINPEEPKTEVETVDTKEKLEAEVENVDTKEVDTKEVSTQ